MVRVNPVLIGYDKECFLTNIPTVDSILARIESYEGVKQIEPYITTKLIYYQDWLQGDKSLRSEQLATRKKDNFIELRS